MALRVLVVEDSPGMRSFVRATLEEGAFADVTEAANGFEALRLLPRERYDLVVTDINMPDIHGLELLSFMRKSEVHAQTPVIIVSTEGAQRDRERGMALGANAYLTKPFDPETLRATARRVVEARAGARERNDVEARAGARERSDVEARAGARERNDVEARAGARERSDVEAAPKRTGRDPTVTRDRK